MIIILNGLDELNCTLSYFRMYIFINMKSGENPKRMIVSMDNVLLFQLVENSNRLFAVYEKKRGKMKKILVWDGKYFLNEQKKHLTMRRDFQGESIRVASGPMMPWAFLWTNPDGTQVVGGGNNHEYLNIIAKKDKLNINWFNSLALEGML